MSYWDTDEDDFNDNNYEKILIMIMIIIIIIIIMMMLIMMMMLMMMMCRWVMTMKKMKEKSTMRSFLGSRGGSHTPKLRGSGWVLSIIISYKTSKDFNLQSVLFKNLFYQLKGFLKMYNIPSLPPVPHWLLVISIIV